MNEQSAPHSIGKVAIVGRPNVGKSELFNRLAGRNIAIVHDQPGITRDRLAAPCTQGHSSVRHLGHGRNWRRGRDGTHGASSKRGGSAMRESDVILFVVDAQHGLAPVDQELATMLRKARTPVVLVINKIDHPNHEALEVGFRAAEFCAHRSDQRRA